MAWEVALIADWLRIRPVFNHFANLDGFSERFTHCGHHILEVVSFLSLEENCDHFDLIHRRFYPRFLLSPFNCVLPEAFRGFLFQVRQRVPIWSNINVVLELPDEVSSKIIPDVPAGYILVHIPLRSDANQTFSEIGHE